MTIGQQCVNAETEAPGHCVGGFVVSKGEHIVTL